jgi:hypothetical protein
MAFHKTPLLIFVISLATCVQCFRIPLTNRPCTQYVHRGQIARPRLFEGTQLRASTPIDNNSSSVSSEQDEGARSGGFSKKILLPILAGLAVGAYFASGHIGNIDLNGFLDKSVAKISELGPYGYLYFALVRRTY